MTATIQTTKIRTVKKKDYLTAQEVSQLLTAAGDTRYSTRDKALILLTFRHGLRATEAVSLTWEQIDLKSGRINVQRLKGSEDSIQVMEADEVRLLKKLHTESPDNRFVFMTERKAPMTADGFLKLVARLGKVAGFTFKVHPHMLRHGAGHALASANISTRTIQAMLGHKNIQHTVRYTTISNPAFVGLGKKIGGKL